jgi:hypothetical protein
MFQERLSPLLCTVTETGVKYHEIVLSLRRQHRGFNPQVVEMDDVFVNVVAGTLNSCYAGNCKCNISRRFSKA